MKQIRRAAPPLLLLLVLLLSSCGAPSPGRQLSFSLEEVPEFSGEPYVVLNDNQPAFTEEELAVQSSFESSNAGIGRAAAARPMPALELT